MATKFITPSWRMPKNSNQSKASNYSLDFAGLATIEYATPVDLGVVSTFSFWMNIDVGTTGALFGNTALGTFEYVVYYSGSGFFFKIAGAYADFPNAAAAISTGQWHHVAFVRPSENEVQCYIDSVLTDTITSWTGTPGSNPIKFDLIGSRPGGGLAYSGKIGQIAGFDYALTTESVSALYNGGIPSNPLAVTTPPVAYYDLGQGSAYASGSAGIVEPNLAAATGSTVFDFDGVDDYVSIYDGTAGGGPSSLKFTATDSFSISCWVKMVSTSGQENIISFRGTPLIWLYRSGTAIGFRIRGNGSGTESVITKATTNGAWHNIVAIRDYNGGSPQLKLYIDNVAATPVTDGTSGDYDTYDKFSIGNDNHAGGRYWFDGDLSNTQIWNAALSPANITTLYNNGTPLQSNIPQSGSLKAWYKLGLDSSNWDGNNWTLSNSSANYSNSLQFNGTSNYITTPSFTTSGDDLTISVWLKAVNLSSGTSDILFGNNSNFIRYNLNEVIYARINGVDAYLIANSGGVPQIFGTGNWHHLAVVKSGSTVTWYIDGNPYTTLGSGTTGGFTMNYIGANGSALNEFLDGQLSNVAIFESALDALAITTLYNSGQPETTISSSPLSWWKLDNLTTGIQDLGSAFNNGTNNGATISGIAVSQENGLSSGMDSTNLVPSNLIKSIPYSGYSMDFDAASDDYIDVGTDSSLNVFDGDFSISLWFNHTNAAGSADAFLEFGTFTNRVAMTLGFTSNTGVGFAFGNPSIIPWYYNAGSGFNDGNWHNMIATRTGTTYKIFVDGVDLSYSTGTFNTAGVNRIGTTDYNTFYDGKLSNVAIFDKALSEDEILRVYNGGSPGDLANLGPTSWWSLGADSYFNGSNWICPDIGANTNNGTSDSMGADALVGNGPNSLANGTSTNLDLASDLIGEAPGSTGNAISINMNSLARTGSTP